MEAQKTQLAQFLKNELEIPEDAIPVVLEQCKNMKRLPVILWQQKLLSVAQLDRLFAWLEGYTTRVA